MVSWAMEPLKEVGGNCSDAQRRPVEDIIEETMDQVVLGFKSASSTNSSAGKTEKQVRV